MTSTILYQAEFDAAISGALTRLRALGNPGALMIERGFWHRDHPGWTLPTLVGQGFSVHLLSSGRLLVNRRTISAKDLAPFERAQVLRALRQLGLNGLRVAPHHPPPALRRP